MMTNIDERQVTENLNDLVVQKITFTSYHRFKKAGTPTSLLGRCFIAYTNNLFIFHEINPLIYSYE